MTFHRLLRLPRLGRNALAELTGGDPAALPGALAEVWRARADIARYLRTGDQPLAARLRRRFGLVPEDDPACGVPEDLFGPEPDWPRVRATVILPVFNAAKDLRRLLDRLPETIDPDQPFVIVDDASDAPEIAGLLDEFALRHGPTTVIRHDRNKGFVASVNEAIDAADPGGHVVILNSDALPPAGWVRRLVAPIETYPDIASVTPFSNTAEILSIPAPGHAPNLDAGAVDLIDRAARRLASGEIALPTGIGFCMAMNRRFLDRIGSFDPAFGRGYGEEVDWCCRAVAAGGRHVVQTRLFVGHRGGASFGAAKAARIQAASRLVSARWPEYPARVRDWIAAQPVGPERLVLSLAWLGAVAKCPVPVFLGHMLGGGAETALLREVDAVLDAGAPGAVVLRAGGPRAWRLELRGPGFIVAGDVAKTAQALDLLAPLKARRVVYSCGIGAPDPAEVPRLLAELACPGDRLEVRLHDFFPLTPSWNLLDAKGRFHGVPDEDDTDTAHHARRPGAPPLALRDWRALWRPVLCRADEITVFAPSGATLLARAYPEIVAGTVLRPHMPGALPGPLRKGGSSIGVLGGINQAKGAGVLVRLARATHRRIVVIGELEGRFRLPAPHVVYGRYRPDEIRKLALDHDIGFWLVPSICPETFSFTTHEALSTGLPVAGFPLGAQADALAAASNGHLLPAGCEDDGPRLAAVLEAIRVQAASENAPLTTSRLAS
jgi:GT2 family glycosyltransferase